MWLKAVVILCICCALSHAGRVFAGQKPQTPKSSNSSLRRIMPRETNSCESRQTPGSICESCELLSTCVLHSNGWVSIPVESCDTQNGYYCNSHLGVCSKETGPCHPFGIEGNFQCTSQGIFPDPYDCQRYHMCYFVQGTQVAAAGDCGGDKAFDVRSGQCTLTLQSEVCSQPQYQCPSVGYVSAWPNNPNFFYVCKSTIKENQNEVAMLYPSLHRCADGEIFVNYSCRNGSVPILPTFMPDIDPNDPSFSQPLTRCEHVGLSEDPIDCHKYYYCSVVNGTSRHLECPQGTYFNKALSSCTLGSC